jgi:hypothetical protein
MVIVRKPLRRYPLPDTLNELDTPHSEIIASRYARVNPFAEGYDKTADEDPLIVKPPVSPSNILSLL